MHGVPVISIRHITWESFQRATPGERLRLCVTRHSNIASEYQCGSGNNCLFLFCLLIICCALSHWWLEKVCVARSQLVCRCRHCGGARACVRTGLNTFTCMHKNRKKYTCSFISTSIQVHTEDVSTPFWQMRNHSGTLAWTAFFAACLLFTRTHTRAHKHTHTSYFLSNIFSEMWLSLVLHTLGCPLISHRQAEFWAILLTVFLLHPPPPFTISLPSAISLSSPPFSPPDVCILQDNL